MALRYQSLGHDCLAIVARAHVAAGLTAAALAVDAFLRAPQAGPMTQRAYERLGRGGSRAGGVGFHDRSRGACLSRWPVGLEVMWLIEPTFFAAPAKFGR
jgi:hypothetical protein